MRGKLARRFLVNSAGTSKRKRRASFPRIGAQESRLAHEPCGQSDRFALRYGDLWRDGRPDKTQADSGTLQSFAREAAPSAVRGGGLRRQRLRHEELPSNANGANS